MIECVRKSIRTTRAGRLAWVAGMTAGLVACGGSGGTPASSGTTTVNIVFKTPLPVALAAQIGTGGWMAESVPNNGEFSLTLPAGQTKYAVAYVCPTQQNGSISTNSESVIEATTQDNPSSFCPAAGSSAGGAPPTGVATGSVDASVFSAASVAIYSASNATVNGPIGNFSITEGTGTWDFAVAAMDASNSLLGVRIIRSQAVPGAINGGNPIVLQLSDAVTPQPLTIVSPSGFAAQPIVQANYKTSGLISTGFPLISLINQIKGAIPTSYPVISASEAQPSDSYEFVAIATNQGQSILAGDTTSTAGPITLTLPTPLPFTAPTASQFPSFSNVGLAGTVSSTTSASISWSSSNFSNFAGINVTATSGYQNGSTSIVIPDLTAISGFLAPATSGTQISWQTSATLAPSMPGSTASVLNRGMFTQP